MSHLVSIYLSIVRWREEQVVKNIQLFRSETEFVFGPVVVMRPFEATQAVLYASLQKKVKSKSKKIKVRILSSNDRIPLTL